MASTIARSYILWVLVMGLIEVTQVQRLLAQLKDGLCYHVSVILSEMLINPGKGVIHHCSAVIISNGLHIEKL